MMVDGDGTANINIKWPILIQHTIQESLQRSFETWQEVRKNYQYIYIYMVFHVICNEPSHTFHFTACETAHNDNDICAQVWA